MVKQDTFLQWSQRINVLDVFGSARHADDDGVDLFLRKLHQRQHLWRNRLTICGYPVVEHLHGLVSLKAGRKIGDAGCEKQGADIYLQPQTPDSLDHSDCQERVAT